ncbi:hypothetical protein OOZ15_12020 [Galbibacter sp. EGI 63066]|uniref:hypothetical protein n=1 Tax=Galbibacter sp. EGI 63066 TaxID=2993559 RepID=UPI0022499E89|nr:hypothetical protein [Galbibacter sp. EGI 63066]MCX2680671.1 hypothetical protein [Galbibacter sp. EGI 63066]
MQITASGYPVKFIQTHPENSQHCKRYVYKFFSPETGLLYIINADYHEHDFFAIKFYAKKDKRSDKKFSKVVNKGDVSNILVTCASVIPRLLKMYANASFGFIGSRTIDIKAQKIESYKNNQRYRLYKYHIPQLIGGVTFMHKSYENISAYILLNKNLPNLNLHEKRIKAMIIKTYPNILNI